jgi:hypothetical protein
MDSPQAQGALGLAGKVGSGLQAASSGQPPQQSPTGSGMAGGLAGIRTNLQQIAGAPVKQNSMARYVPGGGRIPGIGPGTPAQGTIAVPQLNPTGLPNGSGMSGM